MKTKLLLIVFAAVVAGAGMAGAASFTVLGYLPNGGMISQANGLSADGSVAVGISDIAPWVPALGPPRRQSFRWSSSGGIAAIAPLCLNSNYAQAWGVSGDGSTIVGDADSSTNGITRNGGISAYRVINGGPVQAMGDLVTALPNSYARAASYDGNIIVGVATDPTTLGAVAFRWTPYTGMLPLGDIGSPALSASGAMAVSWDGNVVVGFASPTLPTDSQEAFVWRPGGGPMIGLGYLGVGDARWSIANGVSADGNVIVGQSSIGTDAGAFLWRDGNMIALGALGGTSYFSSAQAANADGSIVVGMSSTATGESDAFIWDPVNRMRDLNDVLAGLGVDLGGYIAREALAISADGRSIAGMASNVDGDAVAFVADMQVPEPSSMAVLTAMAAGLLARRRVPRRV